MSSGLTRRRGGAGGGPSGTDGESSNGINRSNSSTNFKDNTPETNYENSENGHKIAFDPRDISESTERSKQPKLTLMEEVLLLGLKDKQVRRLPYPTNQRPTLPAAAPPSSLAHANQSSARRAICPSGTTTYRTPFAVASSWNWPSAAASACRRMPRGGVFHYPTASSRSSTTHSPARFC